MLYETKTQRYNWHCHGLAISHAKIIEFKKYTEAILSNSIGKLLRCEISNMMIAV